MKVILLSSFLLASCNSLSFFQPRIPKNDDKATIGFVVDNKSYEGAAVIPRKAQYNFTFSLPRSSERVMVSTCNREEVFDKPSRTFEYAYSPLGVEELCLLKVFVVNKYGEVYSSLIDFQFEGLPSVSSCDGKKVLRIGNELCQSRAGLVQEIEFEEPVVWVTQDGCSPMVQLTPNLFQYKIQQGLCAYKFASKDKKKFRLTTFGFSTKEKK